MADTRLAIVRHPPTGEPEDGVSLCNEIRARVGADGASLLLFHDASEMAHATAGYAKAFMGLDAELGPRVVQVVCAIPRPVPRMMAWTVAVVSSKEWKIFKSTDEAIAHLATQGFNLSAAEISSGPRVSVRGA